MKKIDANAKQILGYVPAKVPHDEVPNLMKQITELYGRGKKAYDGGDMDEAGACFTDAIEMAAQVEVYLVGLAIMAELVSKRDAAGDDAGDDDAD